MASRTRHTRTRVLQCSHTSVGLAQAHPKYFKIYSKDLLLSYARTWLVLQFLISLYRGSVMTSLFLLCHCLSSPFRCKDRWMACVNIPKSSSEPMDCSWTVWYTCMYSLYLHGWTWGGLFTYHRRWLLSACAYNSWQQGNMRLTADIRLTNSRLINGGKIVGGAFAASVKPLIQNGRASSKYFGEHHSWPSHLQADLAAACRRDANLGTGGGLKPWQFVVSLPKHATVLGHVLREFSWVFWHFLRHGETITCEVTDRRKHGKATS